MHQTPATPYDQAFYDEQFAGSRASAEVVLGLLAQTVGRPDSVLDVGCGRGAWLAAWHALGVRDLTGLDGPWNAGAELAVPGLPFRAVDLESPPPPSRRFGLAMSIEVVEHLSPAGGEAVVRLLADAADAVLFSAAFSGQGGVQHVHERYHSHWGRLLERAGLRAFDLFRPRLWADERVQPWHRANVFLFLRPGHPWEAALAAAGVVPLPSPAFMDAVHPWLYERWRGRDPGFAGHLRALGPSLVRSLRRRRGGGGPG
jgi:SAM-dependent methyltransferase